MAAAQPTAGTHPSGPPAHGAPGRDALAPNALAYLNLRDAVVTIAVGVGLAVGIAFVPDDTVRVALWVVLTVLMASSLLIELPWLNRMQVRHTSYTVTAEYVYVTRGWLWRRTVVIATPQVLNVEIVQGPLLRAFDVVSVRFTCITDIERLGPLRREAAEAARMTVLRSQTDAVDG